MAQHTKRAIRQGFIKLLNERPFDKISVTDIAEESEINRNTFYYYYSDIYSLMEEIFAIETQNLFAGTKNYNSWKEAFQDAAAFAMANKRAIYHIYNSANRDLLEKYISDVLVKAMTMYVQKEAEGLRVSEKDINELAFFYASAMFGFIYNWLRNGMKSNFEEYVDDMERLLEGNIRISLERACKKI